MNGIINQTNDYCYSNINLVLLKYYNAYKIACNHCI